MTGVLDQILKEGRRERMKQLKVKVKNIQRKPAPQPKALELGYAVRLQQVQKEVNEEVREGALKLAATGTPETFEPSKTKVFAMLAAAVPVVARIFGRRTEEWNDKKYDHPVGRVVGFNSALGAQARKELLDGWVAENVSLITGANAEQLARIESAVLRAIRSGTGGKELTQEIGSVLSANRSRVNLIARDQIGKYSGQLDRAKQTSAGVEYYFWRTSADERVRPTHQAREGERFSWDKPPSDGHPGQPIRCRCTAEPDLDASLLTKEEVQEAQAIRQRRTEDRRAVQKALNDVKKAEKASNRKNI